MCIVLLFAIPIGLMIGALILMAAVWLANKCLAPQSRRKSSYYDDDDDYDWDAPRSRRSRSPIPEPPFGQAVLIVFVTWIIGAVIGFAIGFMAGAGGLARGNGMIGLQICSGLINLVISASVNASMLPTTFPRACLVVLFQFLIGLAIALVFIVPLFALGALGGLR